MIDDHQLGLMLYGKSRSDGAGVGVPEFPETFPDEQSDPVDDHIVIVYD
jgi:hypothetical protein